MFPSRVLLACEGDSGLPGDGLTGSDGAFLGPGPSHLVVASAYSPGGWEYEKHVRPWNERTHKLRKTASCLCIRIAFYLTDKFL